MSNKIEIGKQYKLVDINKDPSLAQAVAQGWVILPDDGIVTVHSTELGRCDGAVMGCSHTEGCGGSHNAADVEGDFLAICQESLDKGAFELVE